MMADKSQSDEPLYRALRKAWKEGENPTKLTVDGREVELWLRPVTKKISFTTGNDGRGKYGFSLQSHSREETWIVASPKDRQTPVFNFEPSPLQNCRVIF
jgi:hypothetical protein